MRESLKGLTVIDLTQVVSGAVTSMLLAESGAEVIKIEPLTGEPYRRTGYEIANGDGTTNLNIMRFSRHKRSVALNLKDSRGLELLCGLIPQADVIIENFRPGVLARLGLPGTRIKQLNPKIVYTTVSGFGHDDVLPSPLRDLPAYAIVTEAMAGLMHLAGDGRGAPVWLGFAMADIFAGVLAYAGTILSLYERSIQGRNFGRVDVAMFDGAVFMNDLALAALSVMGEVMGPGQYSLQSPWGPFPCKDGYVVIAVLEQHQWEALCDAIGNPDLAEHPDLRSGRMRSRYHDELVAPAVGAWTKQRAKQEAAETLIARGVPAAPVMNAAEVAESPQVQAREMLVDIADPIAGQHRVVGNPIKMSGDLPNSEPSPIPMLGEHTFEVLSARLGLSRAEIEQLESEGVVRSSARRGA